MSVTNSMSGQVTGAGATAYTTISRLTDLQDGGQVSVPAALAGSLTTRTDADTGVVTFATAHGLEEGDVIDIFWSGGRRYNMKVSSHDTLTITIGTAAGDIGAGDNLPDEDTEVTVCEVVVLPITINGSLVKMLQLHSTKRGHVAFMATATVEFARELPANEAYTWAAPPDECSPTGGTTNPITGDSITTVQVSNSDSTAAATVTVGLGYDIA